MADKEFDSVNFAQLQSQQKDLLDEIDKLRLQGLSDYINLPQIAVCGDQSAGKSSVLEAISGVAFPIQGDLCTRFATELILRRELEPSIKVSIKPGSGRATDEEERLKSFQSAIASPNDLAQVVERAKKWMGVDDDSKKFSDDTLCVEIRGPKQPHLTLIDLPGIIQSSSCSEDVPLVNGLVESYMKEDRTIILAVISGESDLNLQKVVEYVKQHDQEGLRTMGIITKPDKLETSSMREKKFLHLAKNLEQPLRHGWHVVRNRGEGAQNASSADRDEAERVFLSNGIWSNISNTRKGASALRHRLSEVLRSHIDDSMPGVMSEILSMKDSCLHDLSKLGDARSSTKEQRQYLVKISALFEKSVEESRDGLHKDNASQSNSLRSDLNRYNAAFANEMYQNGHRRQIEKGGWIFAQAGSGAGFVTEEQLLDELNEAAESDRGTQLPDFAVASLVTKLFKDQCRPWHGIASRHAARIWKIVGARLHKILRDTADPDTVAAIEKGLLKPWLSEKKAQLDASIESLLRPYAFGKPMTYVKRYMDDSLRRYAAQQCWMIQRCLISNRLNDDQSANAHGATTFTMTDLEMAVAEATKKNRYSNVHIVTSTAAYYEIALDHFIDNVVVLGIEQCLMEELTNVLNPSLVTDMDDEMLAKLGSESPETMQERKRLTEKLSVLNLGLNTCFNFSSRLITETTVQENEVIADLSSLSIDDDSSANPFTNQQNQFLTPDRAAKNGRSPSFEQASSPSRSGSSSGRSWSSRSFS